MPKVALDLIADTVAYTGPLGAATAATERFGAVSKTAFAEYSSSALGAAVASDKYALALSKVPAGSTAAAAATLRYRQELEAMQARQVAAAATIGRALTAGVTTPVIAIGYEATRMALRFDEAMRLIHTQAGASTAEMTRMSGAVLNLVSSGQSYTQSADSMAQGLFYIESEGIRGAKALDILRVAAAGAAVGQASLQDTTNALTSAIHVYGVTSTGAAGVMATLNAAIGQGKLHMEDLNAALGTKLLPTAHALGVTLPQILAAIDSFTKGGVPAESAANALTTALIKIEAPSVAGQKALAQMGISAQQLAQQLQQGGLPAALAAITRGYEQLASQQGPAAAATAIFQAFGGARGGASLITLVQQYGDYLKTLGQIQQQNSPATFWSAVASQMHTPSAQIHESVAKISADLIRIGQVIAPMVATVTTDLSNLVNWFDKLPGPVKDAAGAILGAFAVGGPIILGTAAVFRAVGTIGGAFEALGLRATAATTVVATDSAEMEGSLAGVQAQAEATAAGVTGIGAAATAILPLLAAATAAYGIFQEKQRSDALNKMNALLVVGNTLQGHKVGDPPFAFQGKVGTLQSIHGNNYFVPVTPAQLAAMQYTETPLGAPTPLGRGAGGTHATDVTSGGYYGATPAGPAPTLTLAEQLQLDPTNQRLLDMQAAQDRQALAALKKRWEQGKLSSEAYAAQGALLVAQIQADSAKTTTVTNKAAAAASKAQREYAAGVSVEAHRLQDELTAAPRVTASLGELTPEHIKRYDALVSFYDQEAKNAKLTETERQRYMDLATAARAKELQQAQSAASDYERTVTRNAQAMVDRAKVIATETRNLLPEEAALHTLIAAYGAAAANQQLPSQTRATYEQRQATAQQQLEQLRGTYTTPIGLQLALAQAHATAPGLGQEPTLRMVSILERMRDAAEKAYRSGALNDAGKLAALNEIINVNQQIYSAIGTGALGQVYRPSAEALTGGLRLTHAQRVALEMRIAQAQSHGGQVAGYQGVLGIATPLGGAPPQHIHVHVGEREVATVVTAWQHQTQTYRAVQTNGIHAGRGAI